MSAADQGQRLDPANDAVVQRSRPKGLLVDFNSPVSRSANRCDNLGAAGGGNCAAELVVSELDLSEVAVVADAEDSVPEHLQRVLCTVDLCQRLRVDLRSVGEA